MTRSRYSGTAQLVGEYVIEDLPRVKLVAKMLGKEMDDMADIKSEAKPYEGGDEYVIQAEGLQSDAASSPLISILRRVRSTALPACLVPAEASACVPCSSPDHVIAGTMKKNGKPVKITKLLTP